MKVCEMCEQKLSNKEFNKDIYEELLDICKEYEAEREMDEDERRGWEEMQESHND